jgi:pilin isopeptide linkage protein/LPXTG-motif cell wall-anchored protein
MPPGSGASGFEVTLSGNDSASIGPKSFGQPGVYHYEASQVIGTPKPGYTYDESIYTIEVFVDSSLSLTYTIKNSEGDKVEVLSFTNTYQARATDPALMVDPPVKKTVEGNPLTKGTFTFSLTAQNPAHPMPPGSNGGVKLMTIIGPGEEDFGVWSYTAEGVYIYVVKEVSNKEVGYTYDTAIYTITDTVTDVDGQFVLARVVTNNLDQSVTALSFTNKFKSALDTVTSVFPKTGDSATYLFFVAVLATGAGATAVAVAILRRREKTEVKEWSNLIDL